MKLKSFIELLKEEADKRHVLEGKISNAHLPIMNHLMKLYFYNNDNNNEHWKTEIAGFLNTVPKLKGDKKIPPYKMIINSLWNNEKDVFKNNYKSFIKLLNRNYSKQFGKIDDNEQDYNNVYNICDIYFTWLAKELSQNGSVDVDDIIRKLDELDKKSKKFYN